MGGAINEVYPNFKAILCSNVIIHIFICTIILIQFELIQYVINNYVVFAYYCICISLFRFTVQSIHVIHCALPQTHP